MSDRQLDELDRLTARIDHLLKSADGLEQIGVDNTEQLDEAESLIRQWESIAKQIGHNGKLTVFQPKHGRF